MAFTIKRILVPVLFPGIAEEVLPVAVSLAKQYSASLLLVAAIDPDRIRRTSARVASDIPGAEVEELASERIELAEDQSKEFLRDLVANLRKQGVKVRYKFMLADPYDGLVELVGDEKIDLVAMTTRGRTGLARAIGGSLSDHLIRESGVPVLVVAASGDDEQ